MFQTFSARHRYPQLLQLIILLFLILVLNSLNKKIYFLPSSFAYVWYYSRSIKTTTKRDTHADIVVVV